MGQDQIALGFRRHGKGFGVHFVCEGQPSGGVKQGVTQVGLTLKLITVATLCGAKVAAAAGN